MMLTWPTKVKLNMCLGKHSCWTELLESNCQKEGTRLAAAHVRQTNRVSVVTSGLPSGGQAAVRRPSRRDNERYLRLHLT
ncbi:hypothetical protein EYF80_010991 [Liparis tanakae]|uniref:Uncharacterized protein n=1 Tax=Liparis tanakae TaxID=230148 RepID=A0A4Z2IM09_9TELE|nr:hypothetical protein EYF80_010991 [Liparis tanakae]